MKFSSLFNHLKYSFLKSSRSVPSLVSTSPETTLPDLPPLPPLYVSAPPARPALPPAYHSIALQPLNDVARVEIKVDACSGNIPESNSTHRWSQRINLGSEVILVHKSYTLEDVHRHMNYLFSPAIEAAVHGTRDARYFVYWEPTYRSKPRRLPITPENWKRVTNLLFRRGEHLGRTM